MALHVHITFWYISLLFSAKQQRQIKPNISMFYGEHEHLRAHEGKLFISQL